MIDSVILTTAQSVNSLSQTHQQNLMKSIESVLEDCSGLDLSNIDDNTTFLEMGLDSLTLTQVVLELEYKFGVKVTFRRLLETFPTVKTLAEFIGQELSGEQDVSLPAVSPSLESLERAIASPVPKTVDVPTPRSTTVKPETNPQTLIPAIKQVLEDCSGLDLSNIDENTTFLEMGLDSLALTQAVLDLEQEFGVQVTFRRLLETFPTLKTLAEFLAQQVPAESLASKTATPSEVKPARTVRSAEPSPVPPSPAATAPPLAPATQTYVAPTANGASNPHLESLIVQQLQCMTQQMELLQSLAQRLERLQQIKEAQRAVSLGPQEEPSAPSVLPVTKIARERQLLAPSDVVPKDDIELKLAKIWERLLGVDRVSPQDNFFQLGGRSLLAVRLFGAIEREFGKKLPPATLFSAPTIAEMADFLRPASPSAPQPTTLDSLVMIRDGGSETPLFLIHDANGETLLYYNLASHLSAERPVYGLRPHSTEKHPIAHANIAEMVAHYIEKIRSVQPHGPYFLGGLCAGGTLACEIAMQLQSAGEEVSLVAIIDAADFNTPVQMQASEERKGRLAAAIQETQNLKPHQRLVSIAKIIARKATNLLIYELVQKNNSPLNNAKFALWRWLVRSNLPLPQFLYNLPFRQVWDLVDPDYVPNSQFEGEVVLFRATSSEVFDDPNIDDTPYIEVYSDPLLGWEKRATEGVVVYDIPGGHSSLLQDRNGRVLAEKLQEYIDRLSRE